MCHAHTSHAHVTCTHHLHDAPRMCACACALHVASKCIYPPKHAPGMHPPGMHKVCIRHAPGVHPCHVPIHIYVTSHLITYAHTLSSRRREGYRPPVVEPSPPACNTSGCRLARSRGNKSPVCTFTVYNDRAATHIKCTRTLLLYACACEPPVCVQGRACHQSSVRCSCCGRPTSHWSWGRS